MVEETRDDDMVARVGGDEFVLIFIRLTDRKKLARIARRLIRRLEEPVPFEGQVCRISGSIGIVLKETAAVQDPADLLQKADVALYASKRAGRACHRFYSPDMADFTEDGHASQSGAAPDDASEAAQSLSRGTAA
jgi:diguanylate cyclase (GGDEF)-like protein